MRSVIILIFSLIRKAIAFIKRDFIVESSYKVSFLFEIIQSVFPLLSVYFVAKIIPTPLSNGEGLISKIGYFNYSLVGVAMSQYLMLGLSSFAITIRRAQMVGCLEALLSTKTSPSVIILLSPLYSFIARIVNLLLVFIVAGLFLKADFSKANWFSALLILFFSMGVFCSIGIISASIIVVIKKGDPIEWLIGSFLALISGSLFPVSVLPKPLQLIANFSPLTHSLDSMRLAIFYGASVNDLAGELCFLAGFLAVLLPVSIWLFSVAVSNGKKNGTLLQY